MQLSSRNEGPRCRFAVVRQDSHLQYPVYTKSAGAHRIAFRAVCAEGRTSVGPSANLKSSSFAAHSGTGSGLRGTPMIRQCTASRCILAFCDVSQLQTPISQHGDTCNPTRSCRLPPWLHWAQCQLPLRCPASSQSAARPHHGSSLTFPRLPQGKSNNAKAKAVYSKFLLCCAARANANVSNRLNGTCKRPKSSAPINCIRSTASF